MKKILLIFCLLFFSSVLYSQTRVAVLPFQNMDGNIDYNILCYDLQESLTAALIEADDSGEEYYIVPADSVEIVLSELNLDPSNPQYKSDLWKAVQLLNIKKVVLGTFNKQSDKFLMNTYIYDVKMRMAYPNNQAKDIFKTHEQILEAIPEIVEAIKPGLK
jgi:TolB-like protein